jgi:hypothetical protein
MIRRNYKSGRKQDFISRTPSCPTIVAVLTRLLNSSGGGPTTRTTSVGVSAHGTFRHRDQHATDRREQLHRVPANPSTLIFELSADRAHLSFCWGHLGYAPRRSLLMGDRFLRMRQRCLSVDAPVRLPCGSVHMGAPPGRRRGSSGAAPAWPRSRSARAPDRYPGGAPWELLAVEALGAAKQSGTSTAFRFCSAAPPRVP